MAAKTFGHLQIPGDCRCRHPSRKLGRPALTALQEAQKRAKGFAADAIARALTEVGGANANPFIDVVNDPKTPVDKRLRTLLSELRWQQLSDDKVIAILVKALQDPEPRIRAEAVDGLRFVGPKGKAAIPALLRLLGDQTLDGAATMRRSGNEGLISG